jgi:hypothetical protein
MPCSVLYCRTSLRACSSTTTNAACTKTMKSGWRVSPRTRRSASAGLEAVCKTAPTKLASSKPLSRGNRGNNADAHLKRNATRSVARDGPRGDRRRHWRPPRLWHLGADLFRPGAIAGPGVSTTGGASGYWSRSSGNEAPIAFLR